MGNYFYAHLSEHSIPQSILHDIQYSKICGWWSLLYTMRNIDVQYKGNDMQLIYLHSTHFQSRQGTYAYATFTATELKITAAKTASSRASYISYLCSYT